ncbi:hypothetical protein CVU37_05760 [candidate division BRC1 bacterium HGW-BRC1-1]|jgi:prepilin-type N-terminal cleavage/methylation domain-containing protein|nr:MAG: hypothetical protein CVU37_05760 [candidate division BRC1 bacterium HGW-BRC1-1]
MAAKMTILRARRGFSLLELLAVVAIVGILSATSVGIYAGYARDRRITAAASMVNSVLMTARSQAISANKWYTVVFQFRDPLTGADSPSVWIDEVLANYTQPGPSSDAPFGPTYYRRVTPRVTTPQPLPEGVQLTDIVVGTTNTLTAANGHVAVVFKADGTSDYASVHLLDAASDPVDDSKYTTVKLYSPTAKSKIFPNERK